MSKAKNNIGCVQCSGEKMSKRSEYCKDCFEGLISKYAVKVAISTVDPSVFSRHHE